MSTRKGPFFLLYFFCISLSSYSQKGELENLKSILNSDKIHQISFQKYMLIQQQYANADKELTMAFGDSLLAREEFMDVDSMKAKAYFELGYNYRNWGDNVKTKFFLTESRALYQKLKDIPHQTDATNLLAVYYANIDEDSTAMQLYTETIRLAQSIPDTLRWISPYKGLSSLFAKMGLNDKCITFCKEGLALAKATNDPRSIAALSNNMAIGYYQ